MEKLYFVNIDLDDSDLSAASHKLLEQFGFDGFTKQQATELELCSERTLATLVDKKEVLTGPYYYVVDVGIPIKHYERGASVEEFAPAESSGYGFGFRDVQLTAATKADAESLVRDIRKHLKQCKVPISETASDDSAYIGVYTQRA